MAARPKRSRVLFASVPRARLQLFGLVLNVEFDRLFRGMNNAASAFPLFRFKPKSVLGAETLGDRLVDGLIDVRHHLQLDQVGNELKRFLAQLLRQFPNDDRGFERNDLRIRRRRISWQLRSGRASRLGRP